MLMRSNDFEHFKLHLMKINRLNTERNETVRFELEFSSSGFLAAVRTGLRILLKFSSPFHL